ncbi:MAG: UvrD-helicase domain-containing protein [Bacteroidia bacterium]|nr:UvrD-helicase domain-containing protein [Bacteroidia bacterium]MDW8133749.1 UvrD-helicase domain-containing protein [Bacteroidia bacterium]
MRQSWERELDEQQWRAVSHSGGPVVVLAGAGSGKTRVLTYRIAYLISCGVPPESIIALTFTNKAAETMRQRLEGLVGTPAAHVRMGTFHSQFARWLRQELRGVPVRGDFTIYDEEDSRVVIRDILHNMGRDLKSASTCRSLISRWKNEAKSWREVDCMSPTEELAARVYVEYESRLRAANALDFDDLLLETLRLFQRDPAVLEKYRETFSHILVDEYQDTNPLQYHILKLLASSHRNLFVVGDDAQSIYSFRGADVRNFRFMERDFAPVEIIRLERNYRSTPQILSIANNLLSHSHEVYPKRLFTHNPPGPPPCLYTACLTPEEEAAFVAKKIREEMARHHLHYRDFAILYRTHSYSRSFEDKLRAERIPYRLVGTISFYQREEIKHFLAFLRFIQNPDDEQALLRVISVAGSGIGETTLERLRAIAQAHHTSLWEALGRLAQEGQSPMHRAVKNFYHKMRSYREALLPLPLDELVEEALEQSGLLTYYAGDDRELERKDNLHELVAAAREYHEHNPSGASLHTFLERVTLVSTTGDTQKGFTDAVWLSTVHGVKGMEFHTVFIVGMIEGLFPHAYANEEGEVALEEERRVMYVALTRASRQLYITYPRYDMRYATARPTIPSRFLEEIGMSEPPVALSSIKRIQSPLRVMQTFSPSEIASPQEIQVGCQVEHTHFGKGKVVAREENGASGIVQVEFESVGMKKLDLRYARLKLLSPA